MVQRAIALFLLVVLLSSPSRLIAQVTVGSPSQVSRNISGGTPSGQSASPASSTNGRFIAFESLATDIVSGDTNGTEDVFLFDRKRSLLSRTSVSSTNIQVAGRAQAVTLSPVLPGGFFLMAFEASASNLGSLVGQGSTNNIYVRIPTLGITELVSSGVGFTPPDSDSSQPSVTVVDDGNGNRKALVTFSSLASNLVTNDHNSVQDVFLASFLVPKTTNYTPTTLVAIQRISNAARTGFEPDGASFVPKISADGKYVVFASRATNLTSDSNFNPNMLSHIYRYEVASGKTVPVSVASDGSPGSQDSLAPEINYNGRYVAYTTYATNIVGAHGVDGQNVVRVDMSSNTARRVNESADGAKIGSATGAVIGISASGRLVTFSDFSDSLVSDDSNSHADIFVKDLDTDAISRVSIGANGAQSDADSISPTISTVSYSGTTGTITFESAATNLTQPSTASGAGDVFEVDISLPAPSVTSQTQIEIPPDVSVSSNAITVTSPQFSLPASSAVFGSLPATETRVVRYEFEVTRTRTIRGKKRTERYAVLRKRNVLTLVKAKGSYSVRCRARVKRISTGATLIRTGFSPRQSFKVS